MRSRKILVTGGSGFIGTELCRQLTAQGRLVRVVDLVQPRFSDPAMEAIQADICDPGVLESALEGVDVVYHLAALVSVPLCEQRPEESRRKNVLATARVLEAISSAGRPVRLIFSSSAAVYGNSGREAVPIEERTALPPPLSRYAAQKQESERMILTGGSDLLSAVVLRFFNAYGPGQDPSSPYSGVITIFNSRLRQGAPLRLYGGGNQTRDFVSVRDVASSCVAAMDARVRSGSVLNVGTGIPVRIHELAELMIRISGKSVPTETAAAQNGDVLHSLASTRKAEQILGWKARVDLNEGLRELGQA